MNLNRTLSMLSALGLAFSIAACGGGSNVDHTNKNSGSTNRRPEDTPSGRVVTNADAAFGDLDNQTGVPKANPATTNNAATNQNAPKTNTNQSAVPAANNGPRAVPATNNGGQAAQPPANRNTPPANNPPPTNEPALVPSDRAERWLSSHDDAEYSKSEYLLGVGTGSAIPASIQAAQSDLQGFFETQVKSKFDEFLSQRRKLDNQKLNLSEEAKSSSSLSTVVAGSLQGSIVLGTGPLRNGQYCSLVGIKRQTFLQSQQTAVETLEREIEGRINAAKNELAAKRNILAMRQIGPCFALITEALTRIEQYNLVSPTPLRPKFTAGDVVELMVAVGKSLALSVKLEVTAEYQDGTKETITETSVSGPILDQFEQEKYSITSRRGSSVFQRITLAQVQQAGAERLREMLPDTGFLITGTVKTRFSKMVAGGRFVEYVTEFSLTIIDLATGDEFVVQSASGTNTAGQGSDDKAAARSSLQTAAKKIAYAVIDRLKGG